MENQKSLVKFGTHHFPVGTVFTVKRDRFTEMLEHDPSFEVAKVIRNGYNSYVLETTTPNTSCQSFIDMGMMYTFNISLVQTIEKRGSGPLFYDDSCSVKNTEIIIGEILYEQEVLKKFLTANGVRVGKNNICIPDYCISKYVWLYSGEDPIGSSTSSAEIEYQFQRGPFSKRFFKGNQKVFIVKKKQFKSWIKQNKNRFYGNSKKMQDLYVREMYDFGNFDELERHDYSADSQEGSCYMDDDDLVEQIDAVLDEETVTPPLDQLAVNNLVNQKHHPEKKHEEDF